jgi:hypothetical protein
VIVEFHKNSLSYSQKLNGYLISEIEDKTNQDSKNSNSNLYMIVSLSLCNNL